MRKSIARPTGCLRCRVRRAKKRCSKRRGEDVCKECKEVSKPIVKSLSAEVLLSPSDCSLASVKFAVDISANFLTAQLPVSSSGALQHGATSSEFQAGEIRPPGMDSGPITWTTFGTHFDSGVWQAPSVNVGTENGDKVNCLFQESANDACPEQHDGAEPLGRLVDTAFQTTLEIYVMDKDLKVGLGSDEDFEAVLNDLPLEYFEIGIGVPATDDDGHNSGVRPFQDFKRPSVNIDLLDKFIRRGVLRKFLIETWPDHLGRIERGMLDDTQLFVGYLNMLRSLDTVSIINRSGRSTQWSASDLASEVPYALAFRAQELFSQITSDCDILQTSSEGDVQADVIMEISELLYLSLKVIGQFWGHNRTQSSEASLANLQRNLFENSFKLLKKILCYECLYCNKSTSVGKSVMTDLLSSLREASKTGEEFFPTCFLIVRQNFDHVHPQHWLHQARENSDPSYPLINREPTSMTYRPEFADSNRLQPQAAQAVGRIEVPPFMYTETNTTHVPEAPLKSPEVFPLSMNDWSSNARDVQPDVRLYPGLIPTQSTHMGVENFAADEVASRPSWTHAPGMTAAATIDPCTTATFDDRSSTSLAQLMYDPDLDVFASLEDNSEWFPHTDGINPP